MVVYIIIRCYLLIQKSSLCTDNLVKRQANNTNEGSVNITTVIIVVAVVFGTYFLILGSLIGSALFCFVRCGDGCKPRCTRKPRLACPKKVEDNVAVCCTYACGYLCPCCSNPDNWDSGELAFWIEIVILGILCLPFGICCLVLYAISTN